MRSQRGFTLIELTFVVLFIAILSAVTFAIRLTLVDTVQIDSSVQTVGIAVHRAQALAFAMKSDDAWSIHVASTSVTIFRGETYSGRVPADDESYGLAAAVQVSGDTDITFGKGTGLLSDARTVTLTYHDMTRAVFISDQGIVSYEP